MKNIISKLRHLETIASSKGFVKTQAELAACINELNDLDNPLNNETKALLEASLREFEQNALRVTLTDEALAPMIRNLKKAIEINGTLIELAGFRKATHETERTKEFYAQRNQHIAQLKRTRERLTLEQLLKINQQYEAILKEDMKYKDSELPARFVPERAPKPSAASSHATPSVETGSAPSNKPQGIFQMFTNWMKNLADPAKDVQQSMMSMLGNVVEWIVGSVVSIFKPFLGQNAQGQIDTFSQFAGKAFTRFTDYLSQPAETPKFVPSFESVRKRAEEEAAKKAAATPVSAPDSSPTSTPRHR